jgi:hypothetical protein
MRIGGWTQRGKVTKVARLKIGRYDDAAEQFLL